MNDNKTVLTDDEKDAIYNAWQDRRDDASYGDLMGDVERAVLARIHPARSEADQPKCHKCGLPMIRNPHPDAGQTSRMLEVGCPLECLPCTVLSRHQWSQRAHKAEKALRAASEAVAVPTNDRAMLQAVMNDLDVSDWQCPQCGHAEDCGTMDAALMLRDYLAAPSPPAPVEAGAPKDEWLDQVHYLAVDLIDAARKTDADAEKSLAALMAYVTAPSDAPAPVDVGAGVAAVAERRSAEVSAMEVADKDGRYLNAQGHQQAIDTIDFCVSKITAVPSDAPAQQDSERNWPEDAQNYMCNCHACGKTFIGHKRRVTCKLCAPAAQGDERAAFEAEFPVPGGAKWDGLKYEVDPEYENSYRANTFIGQWRAWQARAALSRQPSAAASAGKERMEFEKWARTQPDHIVKDLGRRPDSNRYGHATAEIAWTVWQARAALAATKPTIPTAMQSDQLYATLHEIAHRDSATKVTVEAADLRAMLAYYAVRVVDADRYCWWREHAWFFRSEQCVQPAWPRYGEIAVPRGTAKGEAIDSAIDAARAQRAGKGNGDA